MLPSKTADMQSIRRNTLRTNSARPKIGFPSLRPKLLHLERAEEWLHRSTPRLGFCDRVAFSGARHNVRREQNGAKNSLGYTELVGALKAGKCSSVNSRLPTSDYPLLD